MKLEAFMDQAQQPGVMNDYNSKFILQEPAVETAYRFQFILLVSENESRLTII